MNREEFEKLIIRFINLSYPDQLKRAIDLSPLDDELVEIIAHTVAGLANVNEFGREMEAREDQSTPVSLNFLNAEIAERIARGLWALAPYLENLVDDMLEKAQEEAA